MFIENFFHITTSLVNCQVMPTPKYSYTCADYGIPKAKEVKEKEAHETMLNWGKFFFLCNLRSGNFQIPEKEVFNFNN